MHLLCFTACGCPPSNFYEQDDAKTPSADWKSTAKCSSIDIIPDGDLVLVLREDDDENIQDVRIRVASQVLCIVSPVFKAMLSPDSPFVEATALRQARGYPDPPAVIILPDDDYGSAMRALLILHHRYDDLLQPSFQGLVRFSEFVDKYQLAAAVRPMMDIWLKAYFKHLLDPGFENFLTIAWVFGMADDFENLSTELVWRAEIKESGGSGRRLDVKFRTHYYLMKTLSDTIPSVVIGTYAPAGFLMNQ